MASAPKPQNLTQYFFSLAAYPLLFLLLFFDLDKLEFCISIKDQNKKP